MALGTMVSCAEYYQDTTTYTGDAGSATNPYAVEDCYDFCNIIDAGYYNFVKDIDFNDHTTYRYGINGKTILLTMAGSQSTKSTYINGKGFKLRNLILRNYDNSTTGYFINSSYAQRTFFSNIDFVNFVFITCRSFDSGFCYSNKAKFENCNFSIYLSNAVIGALCEQSIMVNCTLNISGTHSYISTSGYHFMSLGRGASSSGQSGSYKQNCHFNFENLIVQLPAMSSSGDLYTLTGLPSSSTNPRCSLINCYFTGSMELIGRISATIAFWLFSECYVSNSYYTVNTKFTNTYSGSNNVSLALSMYSNSATSFIATPNITGFSSFTNGNNYKLLTDEHCKDPQYLQSVGFPVMDITNGGE